MNRRIDSGNANNQRGGRLAPNPQSKLLAAAKMEARRNQGLCYNCDEKYVPGHRCKQRITYLIMTEEEEEANLMSSIVEQSDGEEGNHQVLDEISLAFSALSGEGGPTTMRVMGEVNGHRINILIDSGSTLSFISETTAKTLLCKQEAAKPLLVRVANGNKMVSSKMVKGFKWNIQHHSFTYSPRILATEGCDLILGGDWLKSCTPVELDYDKMTMAVTQKGKRIKIQAITEETQCHMITGPALYQLIYQENWDDIEEMYQIVIKEGEYVADLRLDALLEEYKDIFDEPSGLPPERRVEHHILLKPGSLPKSQGKNVILVVIDRLTKCAHFISLSHPFTAQKVAKEFLDQVYKLHGMPLSIVTDRDKIFTSVFWKELFKGMGSSLDFTSAYHPQSDGQTERLNQCLENYLRCMVYQNPKQWASWLSLAEFWYNTNYHTGLKATPWEALYGSLPPQHSLSFYYPQQDSEAKDFLHRRQQLTQELRENLLIAQQRMKNYEDKKRVERELEVGDWVYLKLQPFRQNTVVLRRNLKLSVRYYGPYQITERVGQVAYRLLLPEGARIHPVFHVSLLKKVLSSTVNTSPDLPIVDQDGAFVVAPVPVLRERVIQRGNRAIRQILVQWDVKEESCATWEDFSYISRKFPRFDPWGQGSQQPRGIVVNSVEEYEQLIVGAAKLDFAEGDVKDDILGENFVSVENGVKASLVENKSELLDGVVI